MRAPASLLHLHAAAEQLQASSSSSAAAAAPAGSSAPPSPPADQPPPVNSDMVVILASFLCALICVLGLALVSRCACRRFVASSSAVSSSSDPTQTSPPGPPPPRGLKKKAIDALPTVSFTAASPKPSPAASSASSSSSECAICLADFAEGEALRVLPRCGHSFHVACVDAWLRTRATCPSCRSAIVVAQAQAQEAPVVAAACGRCGQVLPRPPGPGQPSNADTFLPWTTSPPLHAS